MPRPTRFSLSTPTKAAAVLVSALTVAALTVGSAGAAPVSAAQGSVDGTIGTGTSTCSWTDGVTSDTAPNTLTLDRSTVNTPGGNLSCSGISGVLNNDPTVSFDDAAGTATVDLLDVSVTVIGIACRYQAVDMAAERDGDTRDYAATAEVPLHTGSFFCPSTVSIDTTFSFR
ncbi:hypothetical protein QNO07_06880 [Streptomyces sp. 549]|uniref:hypothetical protein n=1 Tax=Streptomyces sp. 549 TaxID=3049076 RepID=UPI0024C42FCB|nr:hypothetical protein [Streptomyces sp. 549]MDK1473146.1 hypothetical protein [Streptomyces sp. 549]